MSEPITVHDVAAYILGQTGQITAMKLQKLCFYSQAWSLVREEKPLFAERLEAWANGPVSPDLYSHHRGEFEVSEIKWGKPERISGDSRSTIDLVVKTYGGFAGYELSEMTHNEAPWKDARKGLAPGERGNSEITHAAMAEYYGSLS